MSSNQAILEHPGPSVGAKTIGSPIRRLLGLIIAAVLLLAAVSIGLERHFSDWGGRACDGVAGEEAGASALFACVAGAARGVANWAPTISIM